jgi:septal ring factor EnvC (AmiA/AmiB activator)
VVYADWLQGYGQMVIVDHGDGVMSLYGHNKRIYKAVGDRVRQSDIIATMGDTAGLKKAALYFEIRQNGVAQDPLKWCRI